MAEWDDELEPEDEELEVEPAPRRRRKRKLAGAQIVGLGQRARASLRQPKLEGVQERRERAAKSQALIQGGRNKGEERGFGLTKRPGRG